MNGGMSGLLVMFEHEVVGKNRLRGLSYGEGERLYHPFFIPIYLSSSGSISDRLSGGTSVETCGGGYNRVCCDNSPDQRSSKSSKSPSDGDLLESSTK